jgi:SnoaL-like domain
MQHGAIPCGIRDRPADEQLDRPATPDTPFTGTKGRRDIMDTRHNDPRANLLQGAVSRRVALRGIGGAGIAAAVGLAIAGRTGSMLGAQQARADQGTDPAAVIDAYVAAANAHDLERILALYADDAVHIFLPTPDGSAGVCLGKEQFRLWYEQSIKDGDRIEVADGTLKTDEDRATFAVRIASGPWKELGLETLEANAEAVVVDGRITTHVVMLTPESVRKLLIARGTIPAPPAERGHIHSGGGGGNMANRR